MPEKQAATSMTAQARVRTGSVFEAGSCPAGSPTLHRALCVLDHVLGGLRFQELHPHRVRLPGLILHGNLMQLDHAHTRDLQATVNGVE